MNERLKNEGRLREKELKIKELKFQIRGLRDSVREELDPFEDVAELNVEQAFAQMTDLVKKMLAYKELMLDIKELKKALGK